MESDFMLMTDNAKRYNDPRSIIFKDASKLKKKCKEFSKQLNTLMQQGKPFPSIKTREKKQKLIKEVGEMGIEELNELVNSRLNSVENIEVSKMFPFRLFMLEHDIFPKARLKRLIHLYCCVKPSN